MKISFDFDETLDRETMQKLAVKFIKDGHDVYITSQRPNNTIWNRDIYAVADKIGIPVDRIRLIEYDSKYTYLVDFDIHFDDNSMEIGEINENTNCIGILISKFRL